MRNAEFARELHAARAGPASRERADFDPRRAMLQHEARNSAASQQCHAHGGLQYHCLRRGRLQVRIAILEDDPDQLALLRRWIAEDGHDVHAYLSGRSEEHTSELQSQSNLVCRLLLEKKKKNTCTKMCSS